MIISVVLLGAPDLEKTQKSFTRMKECVQKAQGDVVEQFSFVPKNFIGLKKLKRKFDLVIRALKEKGNQAELLTKAEEKEKIVLSKFIRLSIEGLEDPEADKAALDVNIKRVLAYEAVAKECNAADELAIMDKLKQHQAAAKEAAVAEDTPEEEAKAEPAKEDKDEDKDEDEDEDEE
ncbi:hypothetical protein Efla_003334 [Eimeria flavescens]